MGLTVGAVLPGPAASLRPASLTLVRWSHARMMQGEKADAPADAIYIREVQEAEVRPKQRPPAAA